MKLIESFTKNLTPVHSLSVDKFIKVLNSGGLKALSELEEGGKQAGYAIVESKIRPKYGDEISQYIYDYLNGIKQDKVLQDKAEELGLDVIDFLVVLFGLFGLFLLFKNKISNFIAANQLLFDFLGSMLGIIVAVIVVFKIADIKTQRENRNKYY